MPTTEAWPASNAACLQRLLALHTVSDPRIIDVTYGHGATWRGLPYRPLSLDIRQLPGVQIVAAWQDLPRLFRPQSFDVVVWDPIHVTDVGANSIMGRRYAAAAAPVHGRDISHLYPQFLRSARSVLRHGSGICIVKLADQVHNARQQLHFVSFVNVARECGWTVCDYDVSWRRASLIDPKWRRQLHVRKRWAFWVVIRNGPSCHGPGLPAQMSADPGGGCP